MNGFEALATVMAVCAASAIPGFADLGSLVTTSKTGAKMVELVAGAVFGVLAALVLSWLAGEVWWAQ